MATAPRRLLAGGRQEPASWQELAVHLTAGPPAFARSLLSLNEFPARRLKGRRVLTNQHFSDGGGPPRDAGRTAQNT